MVRRYYDLPSLTALAVFEASARHLSFRRAAEELNVTPGAVSRQIKAIEDELGAPLFLRLTTAVSLTAAGEELFAVLSGSFSRTADVVQRIKGGVPKANVTFACTEAFGSMWLMPRMPGFWSSFPDLTVDHLISDSARDFRRSEIDLRVRYGFGAWPGEIAELLFDETIYPVCSAGFAEAHAAARPEDLPGLPLLHVGWVDPEWTDWNEVFSRMHIPHGPNKGRRFSRFGIAIQAAQAGQGVALGWHRLVHDAVRAGRLRRFTALQMQASGSYYLTWNEGRSLSSAAQAFRSWLRHAAAETKAASPSPA